MLKHQYNVVLGGVENLDLLVKHRLQMWVEIHPERFREIEASRNATRQWIENKLQEGKLVAFLARMDGGDMVGSGCLWLREEQPRPGVTRLEVPYLMSMYTEKEHRRFGVASRIVIAAIEWCKSHSYERIVLHASKDGKPVYEKLGFSVTDEMRLKFMQ